jgi:hypothetical protein
MASCDILLCTQIYHNVKREHFNVVYLSVRPVLLIFHNVYAAAELSYTTIFGCSEPLLQRSYDCSASYGSQHPPHSNPWLLRKYVIEISPVVRQVSSHAVVVDVRNTIIPRFQVCEDKTQ